jgi:hypothetical protein
MSLLSRLQARKDHLAELEQARKERLERENRAKAILRQALKQRSIATQETDKAPDMDDASISLSNPNDPNSTLTFPTILLYPLHAQSDFVKALPEDESLGQHLEYILPLPWDEAGEYGTADAVECYMETAAGGLVKAGKNLPVGKLLGSGKVEVVDGLVRVNVVPKARAKEWIEEWKVRHGKQ